MKCCTRCGDTKLVFPLHGVDKGGPLVCPPCALKIDELYRYDRNRQRAALGLDALKGAPSGPTYLTRELLLDVLQLTHPDKHPPERAELATRVSAELNALKPYVPPKPKPAPPPPPVTDKEDNQRVRINIRDMLDLVCVECLGLVPMYYCDSCLAKWEEARRKEREVERASAAAAAMLVVERENWPRDRLSHVNRAASSTAQRGVTPSTARQRAARGRIAPSDPAKHDPSQPPQKHVRRHCDGITTFLRDATTCDACDDFAGNPRNTAPSQHFRRCDENPRRSAVASQPSP